MITGFIKKWFPVILLLAIAVEAQAKRSDDCCKVSCKSRSNSGCEIGCNRSESASGCNRHSKTIFVPRQLTTNAMLELALNNYQIYHNAPCPEDRSFFTFQPSYFHFQSTKSDKLARYFLRNQKCALTVAEDGTGDVGSLWLGVISAPGTTFRSRLSIAPKRRVDGGYFNFFFDLDRWLCGAWFSISFAAARVEHTLCPRERVSGGATHGPGTLVINDFPIVDAIAGLENPQLRAGKFFSGKCSRTRVDDVQFKVGYNYYFCNYDHVGLYFVATAPTGKRHKSEFLFEPFIGTKHPSVGFGVNTDLMVWDCGNHIFNWMSDLKYRFLLKHTERRLFDLLGNGDWSRYLDVVTAAQPSNTQPGVNFFNQNVRVKPRSTIEFWTALHYNYCAYNLEVGYNLWWRQQERVCLCSKAPRSLGVGIYDMAGDCSGSPTSASTANITQTVTGAGVNVAPSDATFVTLSTANFDLNSGAAPRAISHTVYGAASHNSVVCCMPVMIGVGGSFEFAPHGKTFEQWGVFVKGSIGY